MCVRISIKEKGVVLGCELTCRKRCERTRTIARFPHLLLMCLLGVLIVLVKTPRVLPGKAAEPSRGSASARGAFVLWIDSL